ncbi:MAG: hypothetical protein LBM99_06380 [Bacillales bacterium]|jgi:cell division protein FtsZ|nr:hypothetical protein [Bacillales bacterium]
MIDEYDALDYFNAKEEEKPLDFVFEGETIEDIDYEVKKYLAKISSVDDTMRLFEIANERKNFISKKEIKKEEKSPTINPNIKMTNIKIIGVGGGGCNAVSYMATKRKIRNVDFYLANTDMQALTRYDDPHLNKIHLGINETKGLGAGSDPEVGKRATLESLDSINKVLDGADLVFIAAGMGGGTGTGGAPLIAKAAKDRGCLTIGIVTSPFVLEGERRRVQALQGIN